MNISKQLRAEIIINRFLCDVKTFANTIINAQAYDKPLLREIGRIITLKNRLNLLQTLVDCPKLYGVSEWQIKPILGEAETYLQGAINAYLNIKY